MVQLYPRARSEVARAWARAARAWWEVLVEACWLGCAIMGVVFAPARRALRARAYREYCARREAERVAAERASFPPSCYCRVTPDVDSEGGD